VLVGPGFPEIFSHERERLVAHIRSRENAEGIHPGARRRTDAVEFSDGQMLNEARAHFGRDDELAVWLSLVGGKLGEEFVVGDAGGGGQACFAQDFRPDQPRDLRCDRNALDVLGDIQIGLIKREGLDDVRMLGEDRADLSRDLLVDLKAKSSPGIAAWPLPTASPSESRTCGPRSSRGLRRRAPSSRPRRRPAFMKKLKDGTTVETPTEARQAERGPSIFNVLLASSGLAIVALAAVFTSSFSEPN
jgi:hypothetical protein